MASQDAAQDMNGCSRQFMATKGVGWEVGVCGQGRFPWLPKAASERKRRPHDDGTERKRKWKCANAIVTEEQTHTHTQALLGVKF